MATTMVEPTRKQRFGAALQLAGVRYVEWAATHGVTLSHLNFVLHGTRQGSAKLNRAIDRLIAEHLPK